MAVNGVGSTWSTWYSTKTGVGGVNPTLGQSTSSTTIVDDGRNMPVVVYVLLGVGAAAPVVLLLTTAIVLRSRRAARNALRRRATFNSAPAVDIVVDAWNSPAAGSTPSGKPTSDGAVHLGGSNRPADGRLQVPAGTLSELAVREFFDVQPDQHHLCPLYVSVDPNEGPPGVEASSSTQGSGVWTSGSESSGEMERRADQLVALIGPSSARTKNSPTTSVTAADKTLQATNQTATVYAPLQHAPLASLPRPTPSDAESAQISRHADDRSGPPAAGAGPTVLRVEVVVEPPPVNGVDVEAGFRDEDDQNTPPLPCLSRMRRSDACYNIVQLSATGTASEIDVPDSPCTASSPPPPSSPPANSAVDDAEAEPTEDLLSEEERALKCLDAIAYDYDDQDEVAESTDHPVSRL